MQKRKLANLNWAAWSKAFESIDNLSVTDFGNVIISKKQKKEIQVAKGKTLGIRTVEVFQWASIKGCLS